MLSFIYKKIKKIENKTCISNVTAAFALNNYEDEIKVLKIVFSSRILKF